MKSLAATIAMLLLFGAECRAEETVYYYLELGDEADQQAAEAKWKKLSEAHKAILDKLEFHPTIILRADRTLIVRVHAGPVEGKSAAQKKCLQLFAVGTPCFVLEGGHHPYSSGSTSLDALPWSPDSLLPWIGGARSSMPGSQPEVEVAEAIRVPLKEEENASQPELRPVFSPSPSLHESRDIIRGWLDVRPFRNEEDAIAFWQSVRRLVPGQAAGLRVRIARPLADQDAIDTALHIGPFAGEQDALEFCRAGVTPVSSDILCRFTQAEPGLAQPLLPGSYIEGQGSTDGKQEVANEPAPAVTSPMEGAWVQVISASNQPEAMEGWEKLRTEHGELLGGLKGITESSGGAYTVRIGPFGTNADAISLCIRLQQRGAHCRVFNK